MSDHSTPYEPLHQPPDPRDLQATPPATPECAIVRGRLRDFVDGDLGAAARRHVEDHVHACRTCAVELSRAEHELLRLRRAFGLVAISEPAAGLPRPGFASRVVNRLVLDETSMISREMLASASELGAMEDGSEGNGGGPGRSAVSTSAVSTPAVPTSAVPTSAGKTALGAGGLAMPRSALRTPAGFLMACVALLAVLVVVLDLRSDGDKAPERVDRLVVRSARDAHSSFGLLGSGDGLGPGEKLWVGVDGEVFVDLIDASAKSQPAATLQVTDSGQVRMQGGDPVLEVGHMRVETLRDVSFLMDDGSRLGMGVGEYAIVVEDLRGRHGSGKNPMPGDLRISVQVLRGDDAEVVRMGQVSAFVSQGELGVYQGTERLSVTRGQGGVSSGSQNAERKPPVGTQEPTEAVFSGVVLESMGAPAVGSDVIVAFGSGGRARSWVTRVGGDGRFEFVTGAMGSAMACDSPFAIVQVIPSSSRDELGLTAPDVFRLAYVEGNARLERSPVIGQSWPLTGQVVDENGQPRSGVRLLPCITDELFRSVCPWSEGQATSDAQGNFRIARLPATLPAHQHLDILLLHPDLEPTVIPVPARDLPVVRMFSQRFRAHTTRTVRLHLTVPAVPGSMGGSVPLPGSFQILEEVVGLPPGVAMCRHQVTADASGLVAAVNVGRGTLWLRSSSSSGSGPLGKEQLSQLVEFGGENPPRYGIETGSPRSFGSVFQTAELLAGTDVALASGFRFQHYSTLGVNSAPIGQTIYVRDAQANRALSGAMVFAVQANGTREIGPSRFLGLTNGNGSLVLDLVANESVVVISADGAIGFTGGGNVGTDVLVSLRANGTVQLDNSVLPVDPTVAVVTVRLQRVDVTIPGLQPELVRFASVADGWLAKDIPPGSYRATIDGRTYPVEVPSLGLVVLH
jgi:hypothetical protein